MVAKILGAQRDFSFGEVDVALKRADEHPARKGGLRQMANARILNSGSVQNRSGRRALYPVTNSGKRTERFTIKSGNTFDIQFAAARVKIIDSTGTTVGNFTTQGNGAALPWASTADINSIVYAVSPSAAALNITITFAGMRPQVITWDGVATWSVADYTETIAPGGQKRTPFYRLSPQNITMLPSATTGAITVQFSSPIVVAGMVGTRVRFCGRQILLGAVIDASNMNAQVIEPLPIAQTLTLTGAVGTVNIGDVLIGAASGAQGIVVTAPNQQSMQTLTGIAGLIPGMSVTGGTSGATGIVLSYDGKHLTVSLNTGTLFVNAETLTTPAGSATSSLVSTTSLVVQLLQVSGQQNVFSSSEKVAGPSVSASTSAAATTTPKAVSVWDEEVINSYRGFPTSCFVDQFRLGFCNFPALPGGISWSAINSPTDLFVGPNPSDAMFEIAPGKVQVYFVVPGPESNEFVFCDRGIFYIPISPTNPLKPGSVQFLRLSGDGAGQVQPRLSQEAILYANAGLSSMMAVIATGAYLRPFNTKNLSEFHFHLFNNIQCIAAPGADGTFNERYAYVLNGDGSITVGKYDPPSLQGNQPVIGWGPWSGGGTVSWIAAWAADVLFTSTYFGNGVVEIIDDAQYLDCALSVNALPAAFTPPGGKGPLWFVATSQTVILIDQVTRAMGTYVVDANGFIVPQNNGGEDLTLASLVAGQPWTMTVEPFCPDASPGQDVGQRMFKRRISRFAVYVINSTGFLMARLFSGPITNTSPALGTVMNQRRVTAWNQDDDATKPPPLREEAQRWRPIGRSFDPRVAIIKDTPGPLIISEVGLEATI